MTAGAASAKLAHRAAWSRARSTQMQTAPFNCPPSLGGWQGRPEEATPGLGMSKLSPCAYGSQAVLPLLK